MAAMNVSRQASNAFVDGTASAARSGARIGDFTSDFSRAQQAGAMADADHRHPDRIRALYVGPAATRFQGGRARPAFDDDTQRMRHVALAFKLTGIVVVLGVIATIALTA